VIIGADNIPQTADVGVVEKGDDGGLACGSNLLGLVCPLLVGSAMMVLLGRASRNDLAGNLEEMDVLMVLCL